MAQRIKPRNTVIVSLSLSDVDVERLDKMAGPRGRSRFMARCITDKWAGHVRHAITPPQGTTTPKGKTK
jgi:hypothetical protein